MRDRRFTGAGVALITPFTQENKIDYDALNSLLEWHIESGTDMILPAGTTGEAATLDREEFTDLIKAVVETVSGRVPVIAGSGTNNTKDVIEMSQIAEKIGADGLLIVSPYYNKPTQNGLYEHYKVVAEAVDLPIILYNVPGRTGSNIAAETTLRLAELSNIVAVKEASGNFAQIMEIIRNRPDDFTVLSGDDASTLQIVALGGDGVVSVAANEVPKEFAQMIHLALDGNFSEARALHYKLLPLMDANFVETNPIPVKTLLASMGKIELKLRLPLVEMAESNKNHLLTIAKNLGLVS